MEWWLVLALIFGAILFLLSIGIPVAFAFLFVIMVGVYILQGGGLVYHTLGVRKTHGDRDLDQGRLATRQAANRSGGVQFARVSDNHRLDGRVVEGLLQVGRPVFVLVAIGELGSRLFPPAHQEVAVPRRRGLASAKYPSSRDRPCRPSCVNAVRL